MTFTASSSFTKTAVASNGKSVNWVAGDKIAVFDDVVGDALEFNLIGDGGSTSASFTGSVPEGSAEYYAVYPYGSGITCIEGEIDGMTIPSDQTSTASNISAGIMVAKADAGKFAFKNVTALLKFNIAATDIAKVVITGASGEKIAGNVNYLFDGTDIIYDETKLTETSITVGDGSTALAAGDYYVVIAPKDELSGLKFTFTSTNGLTAELSGGKLSIAAGDLLNLGTLAPNFSYDLTVAQFLEKITAGEDITKFNVVGVVSYSETQGTVFSRGMVLLQDNVNEPNTGIAVFNKNSSTGLYKSDNIKVGNKVKISLANAEVSAATDDYGLQLSGVTSSDVVEVVSADNEIVKATATAATLSSYKAQYVQIAGVSPSFTGYMNTANMTYTFESGSESINVFIKSPSWDGASLLMSDVMTGTLYGFVGYYKTAWQICPAYGDDVNEFVTSNPQIITISETELKWNSTEYGSENAKTVSLTGQYLTTENLTAILSDDINFSSSLSLAEDGASATVTVYPKAENESSTQLNAVLTISAGVSVKTVSLIQAEKGAKVEQEIYTCGFEKSEDFTAGNNYQSTVTGGASEQQWKIYYGNFSTSSKITGDNSLALRLYNNSENYGYAQTEFDLAYVTKVTYKAKAATSNNAKLLLNTFYSTDGGINWIAVDTGKALLTSATEYTLTISETGQYEKVRIKFMISSDSTKPSKSNAQLTIDDITVYGMQ